MSDSLRSLWGHLVHFAKFLMLRFLKGYCFHSFHPISTKLYGTYGNYPVSGIRVLRFWRFAILQNSFMAV